MSGVKRGLPISPPPPKQAKTSDDHFVVPAVLSPYSVAIAAHAAQPQPTPVVQPVVPALPLPLSSILAEAKALDDQKVRSWSVVQAIEFLAQDEVFLQVILEFQIPKHLKVETQILSQKPAYRSTIDKRPPAMIDDYFPTLVRTIVSQQLHGAAVKAIWDRTMAAFHVTEGMELTPELVRDATFSTEIDPTDQKEKMLVNGVRPGLSKAKKNSIISLAEHFNDPELLKGCDLEQLHDIMLLDKLTGVTGLGPWTVEMFQMFKLRRQDIFSVGDLSVRKGLNLILKPHRCDFNEDKNGRKAMDAFVESRWKPYRSLVCMYAYCKWEDFLGKKKPNPAKKRHPNTKK
ncbi:hypothetical protein TrLO_g1901 [Triparma laevis f. longispina]|uniref:HhH-GPD domain-containing protein n=1 Tax=Triparma laevis f. longispina TaxID=1714387 RepID=A0A9W7FJE0_9STRA|nr:hypothetical protein TrLO_g1901 [Triparma laevis f. longispina]